MFGKNKGPRADLKTRVQVQPYIVQSPKKFFKVLFKCVKLDSDERERVTAQLSRSASIAFWVTPSEDSALDKLLSGKFGDVREIFFANETDGSIRAIA